MRTTLHDAMITPVPSLGESGMKRNPTAKPAVKMSEAKTGWSIVGPRFRTRRSTPNQLALRSASRRNALSFFFVGSPIRIEDQAQQQEANATGKAEEHQVFHGCCLRSCERSLTLSPCTCDATLAGTPRSVQRECSVS